MNKSTYRLYRYKISDLKEGVYNIKFANQLGVFQENIVAVDSFCNKTSKISDYNTQNGSVLLKYIDSKGLYRVFPFNKYWEETIVGENKGYISNLYSNIYTGQSSKTSRGYTSYKRISLVAENVSQNALDKLVDIYISPKVYLYIGNGGDSKQDWLEVNLENNGDNIIKRRKNNFGKLELFIQLPEHFSITL